MPKFSQSSIDKLKTCDYRLQSLFNEVIKNFDCTVLVGFRNQEDQDKAFSEGKSQLKFPNGKHNKNPSKAVDVAPFPVDWNDTKRFYFFAGFVIAIAKEMSIPITWGGDWNSNMVFSDNNFNDLVHFELK